LLVTQGHIFRFWDELNTSERDQLLRNVSKIDFVKVNTYYDRVMEKERSPEMASFDEHLEVSVWANPRQILAATAPAFDLCCPSQKCVRF
jgi:hypothetical protein